MGTLRTRTAGSRLAIILTTVIVTTVVLAGGVALATVGFNSVGSPQIKDGSIKSIDIGNGQVKGADIKNGTVTSTDILNRTIKSADLAPSAKPAGVNFADGNQALALTGSAQSVRSVILDAPAPGHVIVTASATTRLDSTGLDQVVCTITDGAIATDGAHQIVVDDSGINASVQAIPLSGTRTFAVPAGPTTFRLVCQEFGSVIILDSQITALYVPQLYAP